MSVVDQTGINLFAHPTDLTINVDLIRFDSVPEPASALLLLLSGGASARLMRRRRHAA
jgi:hypothetical protein